MTAKACAPRPSVVVSPPQPFVPASRCGAFPGASEREQGDARAPSCRLPSQRMRFPRVFEVARLRLRETFDGYVFLGAPFNSRTPHAVVPRRIGGRLGRFLE